MPYGRRYTKRAPYRPYRRFAPARRKTYGPRPKKTIRKYVRKNAYINRKQSSQIKFLMNARYGAVQRNLQISNNTMTVLRNYPLLFDVGDFTMARSGIPPSTAQSFGCRIWTVNTLQNGISQASYFRDNFGTTVNSYWRSANNDIVGDSGRFKPLYADYTIGIEGRPNVDNVHVQLDLFCQKAGFFEWTQGGSTTRRTLPEGLIDLRQMASAENEFNPSYFKRYWRKRIFFNSEKDAAGPQATQGTTANIKYIKFRVRPRARFQSDTAPDVPGTVVNETGPSDASSGAYGRYNVDPRVPLWLLISATDITSADDQINCFVQRHVVWRDAQGQSRLI